MEPIIGIDAVSKLDHGLNAVLAGVEGWQVIPPSSHYQCSNRAGLKLIGVKPAQEHVFWRAKQILAASTQGGSALRGFVPQAAKGVVHQKLDHIARRKELVAHRQFAAVARCLAGVAHGLALFLGVEVLVDPADGFVLAPQRGDVVIVDELQHLQQRRFAGEQTPLR